MLQILAITLALAEAKVSEPPQDAVVLRAMPRLSRGVPNVYEEFREDIYILKERLSPSLVTVPLLRGVSIHGVLSSWKCTVYYDRVVRSDYPFPVRARKAEVQVLAVNSLKLVK